MLKHRRRGLSVLVASAVASLLVAGVSTTADAASQRGPSSKLSVSFDRLPLKLLPR